MEYLIAMIQVKAERSFSTIFSRYTCSSSDAHHVLEGFKLSDFFVELGVINYSNLLRNCRRLLVKALKVKDERRNIPLITF